MSGDWRRPIAWSFAAYWLATGLVRAVPALVANPSVTLRLQPTGLAALGRGNPWIGLALLTILGCAIPRFGPLLMIAGGWLSISLRNPWLPHSVAGMALLLAGIWRTVTDLRGTGPALPLWTGVAVSAALLLGSTAGSRILLQNGIKERAAQLAALPKLNPSAAYTIDFFQKGVSFTAEGGVGYGEPSARAALRELPKFNVDSIALVPYGFAPGGAVRIVIPGEHDSWESAAGIRIVAAEAHRLGMRVMLKPHVWRLQGKPPMPPAEARHWLLEYQPFAEHYARLATEIHADIFCIGTELQALTQQEKEWRDIIQSVRALYKGPITYAANHGVEFETIPFWDALDYIGVDNYYPLSDDYSATELVGKIEKVEQRCHKPILFTEAGFAAHAGSHRQPWEDRTQKPLSLDEQARSYQALLQAVYQKPWFRGVYWWKVGTNGFGGPGDNSMTPWRKPAMDVVRNFYAMPRAQ